MVEFLRLFKVPIGTENETEHGGGAIISPTPIGEGKDLTYHILFVA
jgi:hypothetical protein